MPQHADICRCACTHMSERTCARDHPEVQEATCVHERSTSTHTGACVADRLPPQGPSSPTPRLRSLLCSLHPPLDPHPLAILVLTLAGAFSKAVVAVLAENVPVLFKEILGLVKDVLDLFQQLEGCLIESSYTGLERQQGPPAWSGRAMSLACLPNSLGLFHVCLLFLFHFLPPLAPDLWWSQP